MIGKGKFQWVALFLRGIVLSLACRYLAEAPALEQGALGDGGGVLLRTRACRRWGGPVVDVAWWVLQPRTKLRRGHSIWGGSR